jgi:hypothetical protein
MTGNGTLDFERLFKMRLVIARHGEMDGMGWWNTNGVLGPLGRSVYSRGFPRTAPFAQARVVFAVARARCKELWSPANCATLWNLPAAVEDEFDDHWQAWADDGEGWAPFFSKLAALPAGELLGSLEALALLSPAELSAARDLKRSADGAAVLLPGVRVVDEETVALLAAGFFRSERARPAVPYARLAA